MDWKLELIQVPVSDVDRAKVFYREQVGFVVDLDHQVNDETRIVQLTPPGSACSIGLSAGTEALPAGSLHGMQIVVSDVDAARAELVERGVDASPIHHFDGSAMVEGRGGRWNSFVFFSDPDGNRWTLQERPAGDRPTEADTVDGDARGDG